MKRGKEEYLLCGHVGKEFVLSWCHHVDVHLTSEENKFVPQRLPSSNLGWKKREKKE